jgi:hypothetical protein
MRGELNEPTYFSDRHHRRRHVPVVKQMERMYNSSNYIHDRETFKYSKFTGPRKVLQLVVLEPPLNSACLLMTAYDFL